MQALWQALYALSALSVLGALGDVMLPEGRLKQSVHFVAGIAILAAMLGGLTAFAGCGT